MTGTFWYMNRKQKQLIFIAVCLIIIAIMGVVLYKYMEYQEAYNKIHLVFKEPQNKYEINTQLEPISFIKETNAQDIIYPKIDTSKVGEHTYVYVAIDASGNQREFILVLNVVDSIKPIIKLKTESVSVIKGFKDIDFKSYIKESYDPVEGKIDPKIEVPSDYKSIGAHQIVYTVTDSHNNTEKAILKFTVKEEIKKNESKDENNSKNNSNSTNSSKNSNDAKKHTSQSPLNTIKPPNQKFLFSQGYDMDSAMTLCTSKLYDAKKDGYSGGCYPIRDSNNLYIGVELKLD